MKKSLLQARDSQRPSWVYVLGSDSHTNKHRYNEISIVAMSLSIHFYIIFLGRFEQISVPSDRITIDQRNKSTNSILVNQGGYWVYLQEHR